MTLDLFGPSGRSPKPTPEQPPARQGRRARRTSPVDPDVVELSPVTQRARASSGAEDWSVSEVNQAARELIEGVFPPLWVVGEVTNFTRARSGHCYFSLRDGEAQLRCVMWRDDARRLPTTPTEGMEVRALGRLTLYPARGEFQLTVSELEGRGEGLWKLALERLRAKLDAEGLLSPARKRALPRVPRCVGIVTSASGAALHDIITVIRRRAPWTKIIVCGCRVQGDGAAAEIADAIRLFNHADCADVLIVGRGGGSVEDLWAFNEEAVARAIAESRLPIISAVGHETDVTIADLVADLRAPTPSAAAEAAVPDGEEMKRHWLRAWQRLDGSIQQRTRTLKDRADIARNAIDVAHARLHRTRKESLAHAARRLEALSPLAALARGFAVPLSEEGKVMRSVDEFTDRTAFSLRVDGGEVPCRVEGEVRVIRS